MYIRLGIGIGIGFGLFFMWKLYYYNLGGSAVERKPEPLSHTLEDSLNILERRFKSQCLTEVVKAKHFSLYSICVPHKGKSNQKSISGRLLVYIEPAPE